VQPSGRSGNIVRTQPCIEAFSATLERRLQLTVRTLGQAVQTPSGILVTTFYSNIGLGRNRRRWKAKKVFCKLSVRTVINSIWTASVQTEIFSRPDGPVENSRILFVQEKLDPSGRPKAPVRTRVPQTPILTQNKVS
jgi:hypothetical protein